MVLSKKVATTIALEAEMNKLLTRAAEERGVSRSEFIRQQLMLVLEQYRNHPKPKVAGIIRHRLRDRGDEAELFRERGD
jgi:metal-responsive CopG/Arc/MetJ family transcriptional regulator